MKKISVCLLIMLAVSFFGLVLVPGVHSQVNEPQNIKVLNYSYYIDSLGGLVVVGQIQNVGPDVIDQVVLTGTAGTTDGAQSNSYTRAWVAQLLPQQKAPFYMEFYPPQNTQGWFYGYIGNIDLTVAMANATSSYQYQGLTITSASASVGTTGDYNGAYMVTGTIKNTGTQAATNITVVGTFFNSTGTPVGAGYTNYLTPATLNPGDSLSFQIAAFDLNQSEVLNNLKIKSYELLVQTQLPLLQGSAPVATPYSGSGTGSTNPTPTLAPGQTSQPNQSGTSNNTSNGSQTNTLIFGAVAAVVIVLVAVAFVFLRKRSKPASESASKPKPAPAYTPKPSRRNRK